MIIYFDLIFYRNRCCHSLASSVLTDIALIKRSGFAANRHKVEKFEEEEKKKEEKERLK